AAPDIRQDSVPSRGRKPLSSRPRTRRQIHLLLFRRTGGGRISWLGYQDIVGYLRGPSGKPLKGTGGFPVFFVMIRKSKNVSSRGSTALQSGSCVDAKKSINDTMNSVPREGGRIRGSGNA